MGAPPAPSPPPPPLPPAVLEAPACPPDLVVCGTPASAFDKIPCPPARPSPPPTGCEASGDGSCEEAALAPPATGPVVAAPPVLPAAPVPSPVCTAGGAAPPADEDDALPPAFSASAARNAATFAWYAARCWAAQAAQAFIAGETTCGVAWAGTEMPQASSRARVASDEDDAAARAGAGGEAEFEDDDGVAAAGDAAPVGDAVVAGTDAGEAAADVGGAGDGANVDADGAGGDAGGAAEVILRGDGNDASASDARGDAGTTGSCSIPMSVVDLCARRAGDGAVDVRGVTVAMDALARRIPCRSSSSSCTAFAFSLGVSSGGSCDGAPGAGAPEDMELDILVTVIC